MRLFGGAVMAALLALPRPSLGQGLPSVGPDPQPRVLVDVNLFSSSSSAAHPRNFTTSFLAFSEPATERASYASPARTSGVPLDLGASYMILRRLGVGYSHTRTTYDVTSDLTATIPDPVYLKSPATGSGTAGHPFSRQETENRILVTLAPYRSNRFEVRLVGGPSFFSYSAQMVKTVSYAQTYESATPHNTVTITGSSDASVSGNTVGFAGGADFAYFPTTYWGVTAGFRASRGRVSIDEPLSGLGQDVLVGSNTIFLGVRFRVHR